MSNPVPTLQVDNVSVKLGGTAVVKDVSFRLHETDMALLSGPNGAGKSTLLRAIVYLLPFAGDITISGHRPASLEAREPDRIGDELGSLLGVTGMFFHAIFQEG